MARPNKPVVFISHNEGDKAVASNIAQFIKTESGKRISVFMSSDPRFRTIRMGGEISAELSEVIADCDVFLFVYTRKDVDWSWCMWEWGIASHPRSKDSTMIVLQCGTDIPKIHAARKGVDLRNREDVYEFVKQYLTDKQMFRSGKPVADCHTEDAIKAKADALFESLAPLIKDIDPASERFTWPYLQIAVPLDTTNKISSESLDLKTQVSLLKESASVSRAEDEALRIFGCLGIAPNMRLSKLARNSEDSTSKRKTPLLDSCCQQIAEISSDKIPGISAVTVKCREYETEFVPVVTRVQRCPVGQSRTELFDVYFLSLPTLSSKSVSSEMLHRSEFEWRRLNKKLEQTPLLELRERMKSHDKNRLPLIDDKNVVRYVIHRAAIDEFIVANLDRAADLTVRHLLDDQDMCTIFAKSFAFVSINDRVEQAREKIKGNVRDVFVTQTGSPEESVRGWLTEVDLAKESRETVRSYAPDSRSALASAIPDNSVPPSVAA